MMRGRLYKTAKSNVVNSLLATRDRTLRRLIEYGLLGLIVFSPLPAASVQEWSLLVIEITALILLAFYVLLDEKPRINEALAHQLRWPRYLIVAFLCFILFQALPFPKSIVKWISPSSFNFQMHYSPDFLETRWINLSLIPSYTLREGLEIFSYIIVGFLVIKTVTRDHQIKRIFYALMAMGIFEAFYGLYELYNENPRILFYRKEFHLDSVTGTFVNRNHFSGYLEMIIPLAIGLILARVNLFSSSGLGWRERFLRLFDKGLAQNIIIGCGIIVMSLAIVFSQSRSGVFILILTFILFLAFSAVHFSAIRYEKTWLKTFLWFLLIVIVFISLYKGVGDIIERFAPDELLTEGRPKFWGTTLRIFARFPLWGTGLGTFASVFPDYLVGEKAIRVHHAHNDYLEFLAELGIIGFTLLMGTVVLLLASAYFAWNKRRHPEVKSLALGGLISLICILVHSLTDFNLHIPANMLLFSLVLSLTLVVSYYKKGWPGSNKEMTRHDTAQDLPRL